MTEELETEYLLRLAELVLSYGAFLNNLPEKMTMGEFVGVFYGWMAYHREEDIAQGIMEGE